MQIIKNVKFDKLYYLEVCNPKGKRYITSKSIIDRVTSGTKITDFTDAFLFTNYSAARAFAYKHVKSNYLINPQPIPEEVMEKIKKSGLKEYTLDAFETVYMINKGDIKNMKRTITNLENDKKISELVKMLKKSEYSKPLEILGWSGNPTGRYKYLPFYYPTLGMLWFPETLYSQGEVAQVVKFLNAQRGYEEYDFYEAGEYRVKDEQAWGWTILINPKSSK